MRDTGYKTGSALILTIVLTSLLAIIGVVFVMIARVNKVSTSAIAENRELNFAIESVVALVSQELASDVPGMPKGDEYYDYPGEEDEWLACLEPYEKTAGNYYWRQISDIYEKFGSSVDLEAEIIPDYQKPSKIGDSDGTDDYPADADGDGVADSKWVKLDDVTSGQGKPIYAAIRVIDNGAMLSVNTAYKFDPNAARSEIDGSSQLQINLAEFARGESAPDSDTIEDLSSERSGNSTPTADYEEKVVWGFTEPFGAAYLPFDISDELAIRGRYVIKQKDTITRLKRVWEYAFDRSQGYTKENPYTDTGDLPVWFNRGYRHPSDTNSQRYYNMPHISTTHNINRIIDPKGKKMVNVNRINNINDVNALYTALFDILDPCFVDADEVAAQIAVNLKDFRDSEPNVTTLDVDDTTYYGFERPCIFISELAYKFKAPPGSPPWPSGSIYTAYAIELCKYHYAGNNNDWRLVIDDPNRIIDLDDFADDARRYRVIVFQDINEIAALGDSVEFTDSPLNGETGVDPNIVLRWPKLPGADASYSYDVYFGTDHNDVRDANNSLPVGGVYKGQQDYNNTSYDPPGILGTLQTYYWRIDDVDGSGGVVGSSGVWSFTTWDERPEVVYEVIGPGQVIFDNDSTLTVQRLVDGTWLTVDSVDVPGWLVAPSFVDVTRSYQRDINRNRWIKRLWDNASRDPNLGHWNNYSYSGDTDPIQVHFGRFNNVGDIGMVFSEDVYRFDWDEDVEEDDVKINLADPCYQNLFQYLTVFDPQAHGQDPNETRIKGRININTAPWYVIAQLPWVSQRKDGYNDTALAQAIVAYRDKLDLSSEGGPDYEQGRENATNIDDIREDLGFESIGELNFIIAGSDDYSMRYYILGGEEDKDQFDFPDLTHGGGRILGDGAIDDLEERDLIFARVSDLVTVRSDVFTAYILVRIGTDGPQKRVIAVLDRSDVYSLADKVRIIALHPVPDPR